MAECGTKHVSRFVTTSHKIIDLTNHDNGSKITVVNHTKAFFSLLIDNILCAESSTRTSSDKNTNKANKCLIANLFQASFDPDFAKHWQEIHFSR